MASQIDLAQQLLTLARDDAAAARVMVDNGEVTDAIIGFHSQQAVEKALKAVLAASGVDFPFTHDLSALIELCEAKIGGAGVPTELEEVDRLSPYGARARYGGADPSTVDRRQAQQWAASAVEWATRQVGTRAN